MSRLSAQRRLAGVRERREGLWVPAQKKTPEERFDHLLRGSGLIREEDEKETELHWNDHHQQAFPLPPELQTASYWAKKSSDLAHSPPDIYKPNVRWLHHHAVR